MRWITLLLLGASLSAQNSSAQNSSAQKRPFDVQALLKLSRVSEPAVSPDGKWVAFTVQTVDIDKNTKPQQIFIVPTEGGEPRVITRDGSVNNRPKWSPDSKRIFYISNRAGSSQIWAMDPDGANAKQITTISTEAEGVLVAPDGNSLLFVSSVYPDCGDDACNKRKLDADAASKVKARVYTTLLYRHWNEFETARRKHLFVVPTNGGAARDLTPGTRHVPPFSLGGEDYSISPDSKEVCYVMNADAEQATSTNSDLYVVPLEGGETRKITVNTGADNGPVYSPDGKWIAFRSQQRAGYEADRWRLMILDRATARVSALTDNLDRNVNAYTFTVDSKRIFFTSEDRGRTLLQMTPVTGGGAKLLISGTGHIDDMQFPTDGKTLIYTEATGSHPIDIYKVASSGGAAKPLVQLNAKLLAEHDISPFEDFWVTGAEDTKVHSFLLKPPAFQASKKYPVLFLIHGGPQGAWGESWTFRWNAQVFAAAGFVVVMPNPRGSTGYGQKFTDDINQDWGGKVYDDILATVDHAANLPYVDPDRMAAAGGSYGGYMVNWMLGHTQRFKAFVSHAGVFDLRSMAGETEEIWFPLWEFKGMPWDNPDVYQRFSPSYYVSEFKTPTLVLHGELDYRVPVGQGMQLFTSLQMKKVPSKMILFPDEGHWIGKPQNSVLWYNAFLDWVTEWTRK
ncbi:MAG: S9 family peptidase [Acidobacteria bacterium]|nr:S9 family peptidase [Acidobacteriota bacterium]